MAHISSLGAAVMQSLITLRCDELCKRQLLAKCHIIMDTLRHLSWD